MWDYLQCWLKVVEMLEKPLVQCYYSPRPYWNIDVIAIRFCASWVLSATLNGTSWHGAHRWVLGTRGPKWWNMKSTDIMAPMATMAASKIHNIKLFFVCLHLHDMRLNNEQLVKVCLMKKSLPHSLSCLQCFPITICFIGLTNIYLYCQSIHTNSITLSFCLFLPPLSLSSPLSLLNTFIVSDPLELLQQSLLHFAWQWPLMWPLAHLFGGDSIAKQWIFFLIFVLFLLNEL